MVLHALHLCSGYGGFELALRGIARTVAHVERDAYAAATLVARMEEARLDRAPIWSDLTTFNARPWRGRVDIVTAGFPCQPFSTSGKKLGVDDDRWIWPDIARIIRDVGPRYVFLENVPGVVRGGLAYVLGDLAALGFDAEWGLLAASAVGAPHKRERFWLVAVSGGDERPEDVAHAGGAQCEGKRAEPSGQEHARAANPGGNVAHATCLGWDQGHRSAPRGWRPEPQNHRYPPAPHDHAGWAEWVAQGGPEPGIRRGPHGPTPWLADALHLGGNGLVPQAARAAWDLLTERGEW